MPTTQTHAIEIAAARAQWHPQGAYLNTASYGLPPDCGWEALQAALADWRAGRTSWEHWGEATNGARDEFAALVGVAPETVATGGDRVRAHRPRRRLAARRHARARAGHRLRLGPLPVHGPGAPRREMRLVAARGHRRARSTPARTSSPFSAVQMATGEVADLDAIAEAAAAHGAMTVVDATQACGWLPLDASRFDVVACHAYKWLMSPRGTAFMAVRPERLRARSCPPRRAGSPARTSHASYFGPPLRLAETARRLDSSPAWFSWVGTAARARARQRDRRRGDPRARRRPGEPLPRRASGSSRPTRRSSRPTCPARRERLERAGIVAAERGGRLRASWHVYNTEADVDAALDALAGA